jgi:hypothetical protein
MTAWRKSSHSQGQGGTECVEVAAVAQTAMIRDSKDPEGPRLVLPRTHMRTLITDVKIGRYDAEM